MLAPSTLRHALQTDWVTDDLVIVFQFAGRQVSEWTVDF